MLPLVVVAVAVLVVAGLVPGGSRAGAAEATTVAYDPPVDAPITDPFRPPPKPWLPGNRGIEYATAPGTPVRAAADGVVTFAGPVAGSLHVTIRHPDGIRTSYSFLTSIAVRTGAVVSRGTVVGRTGSMLHVGARRGDVYIDPAGLWGEQGPPRVRLVPLDGGGRGVASGWSPPRLGW